LFNLIASEYEATDKPNFISKTRSISRPVCSSSRLTDFRIFSTVCSSFALLAAELVQNHFAAALFATGWNSLL